MLSFLTLFRHFPHKEHLQRCHVLLYSVTSHMKEHLQCCRLLRYSVTSHTIISLTDICTENYFIVMIKRLMQFRRA